MTHPTPTGLMRQIFGCEGPRLTSKERDFFSSAQPFGFILFSRNIETADQTRALVSELRSAVGWHAPVLIDQEGGRVERLKGSPWHSFPPPLEDAVRGKSDRLFWLRGRIIAHDLQSLGIDVNCAPTADVAREETHPFLQNRCYGFDPIAVAHHAQAMANGQAAGGVASVIKHMPGHGRGTKDSHLGLPVVTVPRAQLADDFAPFRALKGLSMGMSAHLVYTDIDPEHPATQSKKMIGLIRDDIGFNGLLMTDDISMEALSGTVVERSQKSLAAGCDLTLHCNGKLDEMKALAEATSRFEGASAKRADIALSTRPDPTDVDISALWAEFTALITESA